MAKTSTYLNFKGTTEAAFAHYKSVFGTEYHGPIMRMGDAPSSPDAPPLSDADKKLVMHMALPILGGHVLMGSDVPGFMAERFSIGSNVSIVLEPDTRDEAKRLFDALAKGGEVTMQLQDMFWGAYYGMLTDRFGVQWMVNCAAK